MATREEVDRLVTDISRAIQKSELLSLLSKRSLRLRQPRGPKCLSEIPKSILDERVKPIRAVLETIDAKKLLGLQVLQENHYGPRLRDGVHCLPICDKIRPELRVDNDVAMGDDDNHNNKSSVVRYLHIAEVPDKYTIGIFVFGPHEKIPLHDHPEMCVLSRVLYGDLRRLSLDLDRKGRSPNDQGFDVNNSMDIGHENEDEKEEEDPNDGSFSSIRNFLEKQSSSQTMNNNNNNNNSSSSFLAAALHRSANWLQHNFYNGSSSSGITIESDTDHHHQNFPEGTKLAYRNAMDTLEAPNVASLYPYEGNLHEFVAGPYGAAVLDVLLPPYDDERKRDCTFYHITEIPPVSKTTNRGRHRKENMANTKSHSPQQQREPCLIVPTGQPENFHCISGRYKDLGETDDYEFDED